MRRAWFKRFRISSKGSRPDRSHPTLRQHHQRINSIADGEVNDSVVRLPDCGRWIPPREDMYQRVNLRGDTWLCWNGTTYWFRIDTRVSFPFHGREAAMYAFRSGGIIWQL
jgi:hypothetical protein